MEAIFKGIFDGQLAQTIGVEDFLLCLGVSLALGFILAGAYIWKNSPSKSFLVTLALLPAVVCVVIMMVNGNIGAGVAVAGAFSLVRFRSAPGSAKEIVTIFLAMGAGLIAGMGYLGFAVLFTVIMCIVFVLYNSLASVKPKCASAEKVIKITIPEDLDYSGAFDDIFAEFTSTSELIQVKTTNMGSMFRLTYLVKLKESALEKQMIDRIRERNGNLEIMVSKQETHMVEL
ncbi:MAG: DUF4956 domain-containing protein [Ruminococcaceae bacterium]|nr:DUF4956 domain-containing protein [Oscillospiraceae bacterium]